MSSCSMMGGGLDIIVGGFVSSSFSNYLGFFKPYKTPAEFAGHLLVTPFSAPVVAAAAAVVAACAFIKGGYDLSQGDACKEDFKVAGIAGAVAIGEGVLTVASPVLWPATLISRSALTGVDKAISLAQGPR
ncbi:hypothetical protein [Legionella shakespearei]|uniref:Uncharacterized protein n=1 Tax=Legionella shakespearei DSM 23087 TaxID=1122169 RepID=A0A0W0YPR6_9GAMM|nr:hypothetical protein [Legionella shakespearei]KTD58873.1 hypothetical protein Lsha_2091 [Legionella shakespearei DSM 23087]